MRSTAVIVAAGLVFSVLACESDENLDGYRGPVNRCKDDGNCPEESVCVKALSICVSTAPTVSREYYVKVIPRGDSSAEDQVPEQAFKITIDPGNPSQDLNVLGLSETLFPKVEALDRDDSYTNLDVQMTITDQGVRIPGEQRSITIRTFSIPSENPFYGVPSSLNLLPGENHVYQFKIIPTGSKSDRFPPQYFDGVNISQGGGIYDSDGNKIQKFTLYEALTTISGTIKRGDQPVDGLSVRALDPGTGRVVSSSAVTGCAEEAGEGEICGDFEIKIARDINQFSLRVWRENEPWYPDVVVPGFYVQQELARNSSKGGESRADLGDVELEPLATPVRYTAIVTKPVSLPGGGISNDGVDKSLVIFSSDDVGGGKVDRAVLTNGTGKLEDQNGSLGVDLFPGPYRITVIPPDQSDDAISDYSVLSWAMEQISGASEIGLQEFPLEERPLFTGSIEFDNKKVFTATVRAEPYSSAPTFSRSSMAAVDSSGLFSIRADKGLFRLTAEVPEQSGFAWAVVDRMVVEDEDFDIELPIPFVAELVLWKGDITLGGATVEWYEEVDGRAYLVARTTSGALGDVTALLRP